jgi:hypothetical protein
MAGRLRDRIRLGMRCSHAMAIDHHATDIDAVSCIRWCAVVPR